MMARPWETDLPENAEEPPRGEPRLREHPSPIGQILGQNLLDEAVRALQEDLAMLQAEQERGLSSLSGALEQIGTELNAVRTQLLALAEPLLVARTAPREPGSDAAQERERIETEQRLERLEKQVALLVRGLESVDSLRYQSDVHTRALARLTDLLSEVVRPKPVEGLEPLQKAVAAVEESQRRATRFQVVSVILLALGLTPGVVALVMMLLTGTGL